MTLEDVISSCAKFLVKTHMDPPSAPSGSELKNWERYVLKAIELRATIGRDLCDDNPYVPELISYFFCVRFLSLMEDGVKSCINADNDPETNHEKALDSCLLTKSRLMEYYDKCESPLESAFLVCLLAQGSGIWLPDDVFHCQLAVDNYRLDFAFQDEAKGVKINVETDGHNFHERSPEQATRDRQRDRYLQANGWIVLRFHRKELEEKILPCANEVVNLYERSRDKAEKA